MAEMHVEGIDSSRISIPKPPWEKVEGDSYSVDHVIHAYKRGQEQGVADHFKAVVTVAEQNLKQCMDIVDQFLEIMQKELTAGFKDTRIRINNFDDFEVLIVLEKEDYLSDKLDRIYNLYFDYEESLEKDFDLSVMFTYESRHTNYKKMSIDGYNFFRKPS